MPMRIDPLLPGEQRVHSFNSKEAAESELPTYAAKLKMLARSRPDGNVIDSFLLRVIHRGPWQWWLTAVPVDSDEKKDAAPAGLTDGYLVVRVDST